jgi:hypothetical protein
MGITGDFAKLQRMQNRFLSIAREVNREAPQAAVDEAGVLYHAGFSSKTSPWGDTWPKAESNTNTGVRSGALANTVRAVATPGVAKLRPVARYAFLFHIGAPKSGGGREAVSGPMQMVGKKQRSLKARWGVSSGAMREIVPFKDGSRWDKPIERRIESLLARKFSF